MPKLLLLTAVLAGSMLTGSMGAAQAPAGAPFFRFEADGFWLNLHHYLYVLGRAQNHTPDSQRRAVVNAPADQEAGLKGLSESHRQNWDSAVRTRIGSRISTARAR